MLVPSQIASYGAWQMVWQFLSLRLVYLASPTAARVLVAVGQALQLGLLGWFLAACWRTRTAPEPFWNPPTVNVAVSTVAGIGVGLPAGFSVGCFVLALCLQLALVPWQVWRTSVSASVSASPAVAMMQAMHSAVIPRAPLRALRVVHNVVHHTVHHAVHSHPDHVCRRRARSTRWRGA